MLCKVFGSFEEIAQSLSNRLGKVHNEWVSSSEGRIAIILEESYFFRSSSSTAMLMVLKEINVSETNLELISCAGATGLLNISWGAHKSYVHEIKNSLQKSGFKVEVIKEIPNYSST